jgi:hypothetical protein
MNCECSPGDRDRERNDNIDETYSRADWKNRQSDSVSGFRKRENLAIGASPDAWFGGKLRVSGTASSGAAPAHWRFQVSFSRWRTNWRSGLQKLTQGGVRGVHARGSAGKVHPSNQGLETRLGANEIVWQRATGVNLKPTLTAS